MCRKEERGLHHCRPRDAYDLAYLILLIRFSGLILASQIQRPFYLSHGYLVYEVVADCGHLWVLEI